MSWEDTSDEHWLSENGGPWRLVLRTTVRKLGRGREPEHPVVVAAYHARIDAALAAYDRMTPAEREAWRRTHLAPHVLEAIDSMEAA